MSLSGFAELFLWYEFHQQRSQIIVDLSDKMGLIPSDKSGIKVAAAKYVEAIKRGDTIPYMGTTVTPDIAWKACGDARGRWQIFSGASATSKTSR